MLLATGEINLILESLKTEQRTLHTMMNELERRGFHNGNQNIVIQNRMHDINDLIKKLESKTISISR